MTSLVLNNIARFIFLVLFQALILNHIQFSGYINPLFYVYFILLLPYQTPRWLLLAAGFILGLSVDIFTNTPGLNAAACVLMAFARPFVIRSISTGTEYQIGEAPSIKNQGIKWFGYYAMVLVLVHHFTIFYLEIFRLNEFFLTFLRAVLSSIFTLLLIFISEYLFFSRKV